MKTLAFLAGAAILLSACGKPPAPAAPPTAPPVDVKNPRPEKLPNGEPAAVTVKHILISFAGAGTTATRTQDEARKLAYEVLGRAKSGEDFDKLMKEFSNDTGGGTYAMANHGVAKEGGEFDRGGMVGAFGNVGFRIDVGEIALAEFDPATSKYGWHIIKRIK